jgi:hypothetical protein
MDELHVLLRDPDKARRVLAEFRADLNQPATGSLSFLPIVTPYADQK